MSLTPKYRQNDQVWIAGFKPLAPKKVPCSICYGKRKVKLILGNEDEVLLPCDYCGKGNLDNPTGTELVYIADSTPKLVTIQGMTITIDGSGEKIVYKHSGTNSSYFFVEEDKMFDTRDEALTEGNKMKDAWIKDQVTRAEYIKANTQKTFAWNAGYHMREANNLRKKIVYHEERAILCKAKAKD